MPTSVPRIGIVGARGLVGSEALSILAQRGHPAKSVVGFGSSRSAGSRIDYGPTPIEIQHIDTIADHGLDYTILCADASVAHQVAELLQHQPATIIDNSSAFRMNPRVPLVVPEINADQLTEQSKLIANPNCSTIMMVRALDPLHREIGIRNITVTTYQAVSGAGRAGVDELHAQTHSHLNGIDQAPSLFPAGCAFNVFEHESLIDPATGFNGEETKMINETRRIWGIADLPVLPTCVRVPVERAHAQSIVADLQEPTTESLLREILSSYAIRTLEPGETLTPLDAAGGDDVIVGRIRVDPSSGGRRVLLWVCCDQIRKGAALNAIQILDQLKFKRCSSRAKKSTRPGKACAEEQNRKVLA
jgi:aspartate-semialdehyde dehydrogenase